MTHLNISCLIIICIVLNSFPKPCEIDSITATETYLHYVNATISNNQKEMANLWDSDERNILKEYDIQFARPMDRNRLASYSNNQFRFTKYTKTDFNVYKLDISHPINNKDTFIENRYFVCKDNKVKIVSPFYNLFFNHNKFSMKYGFIVNASTCKLFSDSFITSEMVNKVTKAEEFIASELKISKKTDIKILIVDSLCSQINYYGYHVPARSLPEMYSNGIHLTVSPVKQL